MAGRTVEVPAEADKVTGHGCSHERSDEYARYSRSGNIDPKAASNMGAILLRPWKCQRWMRKPGSLQANLPVVLMLSHEQSHPDRHRQDAAERSYYIDGAGIWRVFLVYLRHLHCC